MMSQMKYSIMNKFNEMQHSTNTAIRTSNKNIWTFNHQIFPLHADLQDVPPVPVPKPEPKAKRFNARASKELRKLLEIHQSMGFPALKTTQHCGQSKKWEGFQGWYMQQHDPWCICGEAFSIIFHIGNWHLWHLIQRQIAMITGTYFPNQLDYFAGFPRLAMVKRKKTINPTFCQIKPPCSGWFHFHSVIKQYTMENSPIRRCFCSSQKPLFIFQPPSFGGVPSYVGTPNHYIKSSSRHGWPWLSIRWPHGDAWNFPFSETPQKRWEHLHPSSVGPSLGSPMT